TLVRDERKCGIEKNLHSDFFRMANTTILIETEREKARESIEAEKRRADELEKRIDDLALKLAQYEGRSHLQQQLLHQQQKQLGVQQLQPLLPLNVHPAAVMPPLRVTGAAAVYRTALKRFPLLYETGHPTNLFQPCRHGSIK
ncbi:hypothetical protein PENTCL1PPCAC_24178, partial [Pristionchus entomophagus]